MQHRSSIPSPEIDVSASAEPDFRDAAVPQILGFQRIHGRLPNYVGVTLEQVERLEDGFFIKGVNACRPPWNDGMGVPLLFVEAFDAEGIAKLARWADTTPERVREIIAEQGVQIRNMDLASEMQRVQRAILPGQ